MDSNRVASIKHFSDMIHLYGGNVFCLNLIKSRAYMKNNREEQLGHIFFEIYNKAKQASKTFDSL